MRDDDCFIGQEQARDDREHASNIRLQGMVQDISRCSSESLTLGREHDLMDRRLDKCTRWAKDMHI